VQHAANAGAALQFQRPCQARGGAVRGAVARRGGSDGAVDLGVGDGMVVL
jgi:hypothetical protein